MAKKTKITELTPFEESQMEPHVQKWIEIGLRTGKADRPLFEKSARDCYKFTNLKSDIPVIWTSSPGALAFAGPMLAVIDEMKATVPATKKLKNDAKKSLKMIHDAIDQTTARIPDLAFLKDAVKATVDEGLKHFDYSWVSDTLDLSTLVETFRVNVKNHWYHIFGGQFWISGGYLGGAWTSFFREVCELELPGDTWEHAIAYENTIKAACWWWPHRDFVVVSERPQEIHTETITRQRDDGRLRLHCETGPAIRWDDGFKFYSWHGIKVPSIVVEAPDTMTAAMINAEPNVEIRRIMMEQFGYHRYIEDVGAKCVDQMDDAKLYRAKRPGDTDLVMLQLTNTTPEPDGTYKVYWERVHPELRPIMRRADGSVWMGEPQEDRAYNAVASQFGKYGHEYRPEQES